MTWPRTSHSRDSRRQTVRVTSDGSFSAACWGSWALIFAHRMAPVPPSDVLTQGPTDSSDQQVFVGAYVGANKSLRVKYAWIGFALSFVFYGAGCVACTTLGIGTLGTMGTM